LEFIFGFIDNIFKVVTDLIEAAAGNETSTNQLEVAGAINDYISGQRDLILDRIKEIDELNKEAARILRCDYANSLIQIRWNEYLTNGYQGELIETTILDPGLTACVEDCQDRKEFDPLFTENCVEWCGYEGNETITVYSYEFNGHDWVYTVGEQELHSDMQVGESIIIRANHFQEVIPEFINPHLQDIFDGAYGAAFEVPKLN
jgi:hypothetical protein